MDELLEKIAEIKKRNCYDFCEDPVAPRLDFAAGFWFAIELMEKEIRNVDDKSKK